MRLTSTSSRDPLLSQFHTSRVEYRQTVTGQASPTTRHDICTIIWIPPNIYIFLIKSTCIAVKSRRVTVSTYRATIKYSTSCSCLQLGYIAQHTSRRSNFAHELPCTRFAGKVPCHHVRFLRWKWQVWRCWKSSQKRGGFQAGYSPCYCWGAWWWLCSQGTAKPRGSSTGEWCEGSQRKGESLRLSFWLLFIFIRRS